MKKVILFCVSSLFFCSVSWGEMASIRGKIIYVRSGPSMSYPVLWKVCRQCPVMILERAGAWAKIKDYEGDIGWVHKSALSRDRIVVIVSDEAVIKSNAVNVRSGPGRSHGVLRKLERGRPVRIFEREDFGPG